MEKRTIGSFISVLRRAQGWTQRDLAEKLCVSDKAVSRWERDESAPDLSLLPLIADLFGITVDELLRGQRRPTEAQNTAAVSAEQPLPDAKEEAEAVARAAASAQKRQKLLLGNNLRRCKNFNCISLGLSLAGVVAALICNFGFNRAAIGFFIGIAFEIAAVICTLIFTGNALPVGEEDYDKDLLHDYKRSVLHLAWKQLYVVALVTGPLLLLAVAGAAYGAYVGLGASSFFLSSAVWLVVGGFVLREVSRLGILPRVYRSFGVGESEEERGRRTSCVRLLGRCALALVLALILPLIAQGVLTCGMIDRREAFAKGTVIESFEEFKVQIEQKGKSGTRYSYRGMSYAGHKGTIHPLKEQDVYAIYDEQDRVVETFRWNNTDIARIKWNFTESAQGAPITLYTYEAEEQSEQIHYWICMGISLLMAGEGLTVLIVYLVKRRKYIG